MGIVRGSETSMSWFDGTFKKDFSEFNKNYPIRINSDIYQSGDLKSIAIVNCFEEGTSLYELADPKMERRTCDFDIFYHVFTGENAICALKAISEHIKTHSNETSKDITLFRYEDGVYFEYGNGHICRSLIRNQEKLRVILPEDMKSKPFYVLPLKIYLHKCPVCDKRSLVWRGMFEICEECGWEDEGIDDPDEEPSFGPNGDYTIRQYREIYHKLKEMDSNYRWTIDVEKEDSIWRKLV